MIRELLNPFYVIGAIAVLIEAVQLTALRFDTDRDYRKLMSKGESTTEFLKTTEGIITITAPILASMLLIDWRPYAVTTYINHCHYFFSHFPSHLLCHVLHTA